MSITDELRKWAEEFWKFANESIHKSELLAIADHIDAEHKRIEKIVSSAYDSGYDAGLAEVYSDENIRSLGYVKLPVDSDGETICLGDMMEGMNKYDTLSEVTGRVIGIDFDINGTAYVAIQSWSKDGKSWCRVYLDPYASLYRHHKLPIVEDVLWELLNKTSEGSGYHDDTREGIGAIVSEYAKRLTLVEKADE